MSSVGSAPPVGGSGYVGNPPPDPDIVNLLKTLEGEITELINILKGGAKERGNITAYNLISAIKANWANVQDYMQNNPYPNNNVIAIWLGSSSQSLQAAMKLITDGVPPYPFHTQEEYNKYWNFVCSPAFLSDLENALGGNGGYSINALLNAEKSG